MAETEELIAEAMKSLKVFAEKSEEVGRTVDKASNSILLFNPIAQPIKQISTIIRMATLDETLDIMKELMDLMKNPTVQATLDALINVLEFLLSGTAEALDAIDLALQKVYDVFERILGWLGIKLEDPPEPPLVETDYTNLQGVDPSTLTEDELKKYSDAITEEFDAMNEDNLKFR